MCQALRGDEAYCDHPAENEIIKSSLPLNILEYFKCSYA